MPPASKDRGDGGNVDRFIKTADTGAPAIVGGVQDRCGPRSLRAGKEVDESLSFRRHSPTLGQDLWRNLGPDQASCPANIAQDAGPETNSRARLQPEELIDDLGGVCS